MALLEVLAAVVILTIAGLSMVSLVSEATGAARVVAEREAEQADESRLLSAETLLSRSDLDLRIGIRQVGPYVISLARPEPALYRIAVARNEAADVEDLVTVVYRPVPK